MRRVKDKLVAMAIYAEASVIDEAYIEKYVNSELTKEYKDNSEGFLVHLPKVPKEAVGKGGIYKHMLIDNIEVVIDNDTDFTGPVATDKKHLFIPWKTVDTKPQKVTRSAVRGIIYDEKSVLKKRQLAAVNRKTRDFLLHVVAPQTDATTSRVIQMADGMKYAELAKAGTILEKLDISLDDCIVVFAPDHVLDLRIEQGVGKAFREVMVNEKTAALNDFAGFPHMYKSNKVPYYTAAGEKKAFGSIVTGTDKPATIIIHGPEVVFHREAIEAYLNPKVRDTRSKDPGDEFRIGGYFAADILQNIGFIALI